MRTLLLLACSTLIAPALGAQTVEPPFSDDYEIFDLGEPVGIPGNLGGITLRRDQPDTLFVVGQATRAAAAVYRVALVRGSEGHVVGFTGTAVFHAAAPNADGGLRFGPRGVIFFTRYNMNELGQILPGSSGMDKSIPLSPLGIASSVGGLAFIPRGFPRPRDLTIASFNASRTYTVTLAPDGAGTFDITSVTPGAILSGGLEGYGYVPSRSPQFTDHGHVVVCEWGAHVVTTYALDPSGDPDPATREVLVSGIPGCIGAVFDPLTGDLLISIYGTGPGSTNHVFAVRGFGAPRIRWIVGPPGTAPRVSAR